LGWRTYEDLMGFWTGTAESNPFTEVLVNSPKYVVCSSQRELQWPNSTLLIGKPAEQIDLVRKETDLGITLMGSCALFRALHSAALIDDYVLQIHPITLGSGRKLFGPGERKNLEVVRSEPTGTGVIIAHYWRSRSREQGRRKPCGTRYCCTTARKTPRRSDPKLSKPGSRPSLRMRPPLSRLRYSSAERCSSL